MPLEKRDYQQRVIDQVIEGVEEKNLSTFMIQSPTGCLVGDTEININRAGKGGRITLREAYLRQNDGDPNAVVGTCRCGCGSQTFVPTRNDRSKGWVTGVPIQYVGGHHRAIWDHNVPTKVRSFVGQHIGLHVAEQFVQSGVKEVYNLVLADRKGLIGTFEHPIMTREGWVPLGELTKSMEVMIDTLRPQSQGQVKPRIRDSYITNLWNHPFGIRVLRETGSMRVYTIRVPLHRAIWEAHHNNLALAEYVEIMRCGDPTGLTLVDPTVFDIHHIDGDHFNNDPENLRALTEKEHAALHDLTSNFGQGFPGFSRVESVEWFSEEMTYDVQCTAPHHNFVANGIVVHNSGKSIMGLSLAQHFYHTRGWKTNWVAMRRKLLTQILELQEEHFPEEVKHGYVTPVSMFDRTPLLGQIMVADEGHHDACASAAVMHARVQPKLVIGLSATPMRTDKLRLAFQKTIVDAGIYRLIGEGWLSQFNHWNIPEHTPESVAYFYLMDREKWGKTAVFFLSIRECLQFQAILAMAGVRCNVVSSRMPEVEREARLDEFEHGDVDVVANVFILSEGYDYRALKTVFVRDSTRLPAIQICGRVLRLHSSKVEGANIVQSIKTYWPFTRTAGSKNTSLWQDGEWLTLTGKNEKVQTACDHSIQAIAASTFEPLPKHLLDQQMKRRPRIWRRNRNQWRQGRRF